MTIYLTHVLNGLSFAALLFLISSGFTLAFGLMKIVNIAHGSFYMLGAYVSVTVMLRTGSFALAVLAGLGTVLVAGGSSANMSQASAELFDPTTGNFSPTGSLTTVRSSPAAMLLQNHTVLVVGGGDINFDALSSAELYQ